MARGYRAIVELDGKEGALQTADRLSRVGKQEVPDDRCEGRCGMRRGGDLPIWGAHLQQG